MLRQGDFAGGSVTAFAMVARQPAVAARTADGNGLEAGKFAIATTLPVPERHQSNGTIDQHLFKRVRSDKDLLVSEHENGFSIFKRHAQAAIILAADQPGEQRFPKANHLWAILAQQQSALNHGRSHGNQSGIMDRFARIDIEGFNQPDGILTKQNQTMVTGWKVDVRFPHKHRRSRLNIAIRRLSRGTSEQNEP